MEFHYSDPLTMHFEPGVVRLVGTRSSNDAPSYFALRVDGMDLEDAIFNISEFVEILEDAKRWYEGYHDAP